MGPSVSFLCIRGSVHQLSVHPRDHLSTFRVSAGLFVNIRQIFVLPQDLMQLSIWHAFPSSNSINFSVYGTGSVATEPSVNFRQPSVRPRDNLLTICASAGTSVNIVNSLCDRRIFRKLSVHPCELPSTFPTSTGPSINLYTNILCICGTFCQLSVHPWDLSATFRESAEISSTSVNFLYGHRTFCQHASTLCSSAG